MTEKTRNIIHIMAQIFSYLDEHPEIQDEIFKNKNEKEITVPDIYDVYTKNGLEGLTQALEGLELDELKEVVKTYRLDPKRYFYKWTTKKKFISFIKEKIESKLNKGKSFVSEEENESDLNEQ